MGSSSKLLSGCCSRGRRSRRVAREAPEAPLRRRSARDNGAANKNLAEPGSSEDDDFLDDRDEDEAEQHAPKRTRLNNSKPAACAIPPRGSEFKHVFHVDVMSDI